MSDSTDMDSSFSFLGAAQAKLLNEILTRRNPSLLEQARQAGSVTRSGAEAIVTAMSDELIDNLDGDWEPTAYGQSVSALLAQFNAARIGHWA